MMKFGDLWLDETDGEPFIFLYTEKKPTIAPRRTELCHVWALFGYGIDCFVCNIEEGEEPADSIGHLRFIQGIDETVTP